MYDPTKAQKYLNPGEMEMLLSPIDRAVYGAITERMPGKKIELKTGISKMATVLACYRLVGLGLIVERPGRLGGKGAMKPLPKRVDHASSRPHQK